MSSQNCKNVARCPIFTGALEGKTTTTKVYKKQYCEAGEDGWNKCKRYQVSEKTGKCPPNLLPNSFKTVDEIIAALE